MIISVTGFGSTGASAYIDLIKEFENVQFFPGSMEFQILHEPDGILDLERSILNGCRTNMQVAISRFSKNDINRSVRLDIASHNKFRLLKKKYISQIANICWRGKSVYDPVDQRKWYDNRYFRLINRAIDHYLIKKDKYNSWPPETNRSISSITSEQFNEITRSFLKSLFESCGFDVSGNILLEQLYNASMPFEGNHLLPSDSLSIVVDRDPRDVYIITNYLFPYYNRFMPHSRDVDTFIKYYKSIHRKKNSEQLKSVLYLNYEDIIYNYNKTISLLSNNLLGLKHKHKKKYFKPECSINNTQLFKKGYENQIDEIKRIEKELPEFLYPFEKHRIDFVPLKTKPFEIQI